MRPATILLHAVLAGTFAGCMPVPARATPIAVFAPPTVLIAMNTMDCRIEAQRTGGIMQLTGIVQAHADTIATARMRVRRSGAAGQSDNTQGGVFAVGAGKQTTVGTVAVSAAPNDDLSAELTVEWEGGSTSCAYPSRT